MSTFIRRILEPLTILPSQMAWRDAREQPPELRLVFAMFDDAIRTVLQYPKTRRRHERHEYDEAVAWVRSDEREWPFAFVNVCDLLGLDVDAVRAHVLRRRVQPGDERLRKAS